MKTIKLILFIVAVYFVQGCASFSYTNKKPFQAGVATKATYDVVEDRGSIKQKALVILSLSGGGSRAAYWSGSIMLGLEDVFKDEGINLLKEVDIISSVSGGSLPAAYYVISKDPGNQSDDVESNREWNPATVKKLMSRNYKIRWLGNWFWPENILKYWFTAFDRSDIMAQTFADNLYDVKTIGYDLKFKDINAERPYIVLNATNGSAGAFDEKFTFTREDFEKINSDINEYHIGRAVMATAAFPAAFNYMTLRNFAKLEDPKRYIHVYDGGNFDNLGLESVKKIIEVNQSKYRKIVVILIDAYTKRKGVSSKDYDARKFFDYAVDLNFLDSFDSLLAANRLSRIEEFKKTLYSYTGHETLFYHIQFTDFQNGENLTTIKTDFKIDPPDVAAIDTAVNCLIVKENRCLRAIKDIVFSGSSDKKMLECSWER
jgi:predicted acylesterase/phospholipase RssA